MNIRRIAYLLVLSMAISVFPVICTAEEDTAYAVFSSAKKVGFANSIDCASETKNMQAVLPMGGSASLETKEGKSGWILHPSDIYTSYIRCRIDDTFMYNLKADDTVAVEVEYWDGMSNNYGGFSIYYDALGGKRKAEFVQLESSSTWKKHTFILYDARFANGIDTDDFQLITNGTNKAADENGIMDVSPNSVVIGSVTVKKLNTKSPYEITAETGRTGNIFYEGDKISFDMTYRALADGYGGENITYTVRDYSGNTVYTTSAQVSGDSETLTLPQLKYGVYYLEVSLSGGAVAQTETIDFSYSRRANKMNDRFGTNVHYDDAVYDEQDIMALSDLIKNAGYGFTRNSVRWNQVEKTKGNYSMPQNTMTAMRYNDRIGLKTLAVLGCDNPLYDHYPYLLDSDIQRKAYADYCGYVVGELKPYTNYFASPNEYNLISGTNHTEHAIPFTKLVKTAYPEIKKANPNAFIVSGEVGRYEEEYNNVCYNEGILDYCDAFSIHIYDYVGGPEVDTLLPPTQKHHDTLKAKNPAKEAWMTESGWPARRIFSDEVLYHLWFATEELQAKWYSRSLALHSDPDIIDKYFHYSFVDNNVGYFNVQNFFGIVRAHDYKTPFAAKPAYITTAAFNDVIGDAKFKENLANEYLTYAYRFENSDKEEIICLWKQEWGRGTEFTYKSDKPYLEITDMYGNSSYVKNTGEYTLAYGTEPVYIRGVDGEGIELDMTSGSMWLLKDNDIEITVKVPVADSESISAKIVLASYDQNGVLIDAEQIEPVIKDGEYKINRSREDVPNLGAIKIMAFEDLTAVRPVAAAASIDYWGTDSQIGCIKNGEIFKVSGKLPGANVGEDCLITVLDRDVTKDKLTEEAYPKYILWQDMSLTDERGGYSFEFKLPKGYDKDRILIQISGMDYTGQCVFYL